MLGPTGESASAERASASELARLVGSSVGWVGCKLAPQGEPHSPTTCSAAATAGVAGVICADTDVHDHARVAPHQHHEATRAKCPPKTALCDGRGGSAAGALKFSAGPQLSAGSGGMVDGRQMVVEH